ncbi:hypothetical protein QR680_001099 [Steinernema hermaphroditum]|uniref:Homeobox domain-containing protein n=1 Tax=Steinernema hermaphroditum TaxID=289476 RepID=A0AA39LF81_9BILA|nr:hypothetical protein QR680_001099 [Steinernema hermaphroditum]
MTSSESPITFTNIMGQGRVNQLGGVFINGRPLPHPTRVQIIEMAKHGIKPCQISRQLKVSHGAVSKILNRYAETGSVSPGQIGGNPRSRLSIQSVEKHILQIKEENPGICANDIRELLIEQHVCSRQNAPTVSSINRHLRSRGLTKSSSTSLSSSSSSISSSSPTVSSSSSSSFLCDGTPKKPRLNHSIEHILGISLDDSKCSTSLSSDDESAGSCSNEFRRNRTSFTTEQLETLENAFKRNSYPDATEREAIAKSTNLNEDKIMTWFSNRRARNRKNYSVSTGTDLIVPITTTSFPTLHMQFPPYIQFSPEQKMPEMVNPMFLYPSAFLTR